MPIWLSSSSPGPDEIVTARRAQFAPEELTAVLSHYPLGTIESTTVFPRGSRRSPKMVITASAGKFLLKRRAPGKSDRPRVEFSHAIQMHLATRQFPLPRLIFTADQQTFLHYCANTYELFEFISADHYPGTLESTTDAGRILAIYHQLLADFSLVGQPPTNSYHRARSVQQSFVRIQSTGQVSTTLLGDLQKLYESSAEVTDQAGFTHWPARIVHADWHPGNMLFLGDRIAAVLDFDAARKLPLAIDLANGALQFSMIDGHENAGKWPDETDLARFRKFLHGYRAIAPIFPGEASALPSLMLEALIAEAIYPIAATGMFGDIHGELFLHMIARKANWLANHALELRKIAENA